MAGPGLRGSDLGVRLAVFFEVVFRSSFGASFVADFVRPFRPLVGFCWLALTLEQKPIFSFLGGRWPALVRPLFQVFIPGCVFYACLSEIL